MIQGMQPLHPSSQICARPGLVSQELDGETVILHLDGGRYFELNRVGTRVWELLQQPRTVGALAEIMVREFDVSPTVCGQDLERWLSQLIDNGLVTVQADDGEGD